MISPLKRRPAEGKSRRKMAQIGADTDTYVYVCMAIYMNSIRREVMCIWNSSNSQ